MIYFISFLFRKLFYYTIVLLYDIRFVSMIKDVNEISLVKSKFTGTFKNYNTQLNNYINTNTTTYRSSFSTKYLLTD